MPQLPPLVAELRVKASDVHTKFGEAMKASDELARKSSGDAHATGSAYDKMGRVSGVAFLGMVGGIGTVVGASAKMAADFQEKMTLLVTGAGESQANVSKVANGILNMAPKVQTSSDQLADGMYMIESAGFHGAQGLSVLKAAAEGAKVGNADMSTTADALTTVLKDYHIPASKAADVTSQLVATVASGKTHMQDLAASMASILPFSSGLGVSLKDTMGAMATMTGQGVQASNAATYLKFTMMALANETPKGAQALQSVGLSSAQVADSLKSKGLSGTLEMITDAIGKKFPKGSAAYTAALADAVGGTRGMAAALALTGQNMSTYQANIKKIGGATADAAGDVNGFDDTSHDLNNELAGLGAAFQSAGIRLGTLLIPAMTSGVKYGMQLFDWFSKNHAVLMALVISIGALTGALAAIYIGVKAVQAYNAVVTLAQAAQKLMNSGVMDTIRLMGMYGAESVRNGLKSVGSAVASGTAWAVNAAKGFGSAIASIVSYGATTVATGAKSVASATSVGVAWVASNARSLASFVAMTAGMVANKAITLALSGAAKVYTAAQWLMNAAMEANPIGLVIAALTALVAAVILAYNKVGWFRDGVNAAWSWIKSASQATWSFISNYIFAPFGQGIAAIGTAFSNTSRFISATWNRVREAAAAPVRFIVDTVYNHGIRSIWNTIAGAVGLGSLSLPSISANFADGGIFGVRPGYTPGRDTHLIGVSGGEAIMRPEWARAVGANRIHAMNAMSKAGNVKGLQKLMGFADGGVVGDILGGIGGFVGGIGSAVGNVVSTVAGFISNPLGSIAKLITGPVKAMLGGIEGTTFGQIVAQLPLKIITGLGSAVVNGLKGLMGGGSQVADPGGGVDRWAPMVLEALRMVGQPASLLNTTLRRMNQESGGNPNAINNWDINAQNGDPSRGLMQVIGSTFAAYAMPGFNSNIYDPMSNILASMRYAISVYGSLAAAYDQAGGYSLGGVVPVFDQGGWVPPGRHTIDNRTGDWEHLSNTTKGRGQTTVNVYVTSTADPHQIAAEMGYQLLLQG